jgi:NitT/TauT family transport system substrate-binding protein
MTRRTFLLVAGAGATVTLIDACAPGSGGAPASASAGASAAATTKGPPFKMTGASANVAIRPEIANTLLGMHPKLHWYTDENIDAKFIGADGGQNGLQLVQTKQVTTAMANHDPIFASANKGVDPLVKMYYQFGYAVIYRVAVRPDSPIQDLAQLKGKQIGTAIGGSAHTFVAAVLKTLGIDPVKDVSFVAAAGAAGGQALTDGKVDALASFDTDFASLQTIYNLKLRFLAQPEVVNKLKVGSALCAHNDLIRDQPDLIASMGRVAAKGVLFMQANPEASIRLFWDLFPESAPKGVSLDEATKQLVPGITERVKLMSPQGKPNELGSLDPEAWKAYVQFQGLPQVDPTKYLTNQFIPAINTFDHDAITRLAKTF